MILPLIITEIAKKFSKSGYKCYLVGGSLRDLLLGKTVSDLDIATDAKPEEISVIFPESFYNNDFGTVGIKTESGSIIEATTFRLEGKYSDNRHPDQVKYTKDILEDLARRDFTINALALDLEAISSKSSAKSLEVYFTNIKRMQENVRFEDTLDESKKNLGPGIEGEEKVFLEAKRIPKLGSGDFPSITLYKTSFVGLKKDSEDFIIDRFQGKKDLEAGLIRAVNDPEKRFQEDALRLMRAVRFASELGFKIERKTAEAIKKNASLLGKVSKERIKDELTKIILSNWPAEGIVLLHKLGLLKEILPVLEEGVGIEQNWHHIYSVFSHCVLSLKFCPSSSLEVRLASLLHDVAKPKVKRFGKNSQPTFYFHEVEGEKMARKALQELRFSGEIIDEVGKLVRFHMFNFDHLKHNESTVRRILHRVGGLERMEKLLELRIADRLGSGCHQGEVFKLRKLKYLIEKVSSDPISLKQLKLNGKDLMENLKIKPGPILGDLLEILLAEVVANPSLNKKEKLIFLAREALDEEKKLPGSLSKKQEKAILFLEGKKEEEDGLMQEKYRVRTR